LPSAPECVNAADRREEAVPPVAERVHVADDREQSRCGKCSDTGDLAQSFDDRFLAGDPLKLSLEGFDPLLQATYFIQRATTA
jgi:hypothetical protein